MEFKGTIGKWKLSESKTFGRQMVDLGDFNGCIDVWYHNGESMTKEEAEANAKLIAAAPELLEALQNSLSALLSLTGNPKNEWEEVKQAEEAINKALGL
jgi:roadblock/LC7 domain-containing protein